MAILYCKKCSKLFDSRGLDLCLNCRKELDESYKIVKKYIQNNPNANIATISEETNIETNDILSFIKQGRILVSDPNLICNTCRKIITTGEICEQCAKKLTSELRVAAKSITDEINVNKNTTDKNKNNYDKFHLRD